MRQRERRIVAFLFVFSVGMILFLHARTPAVQVVRVSQEQLYNWKHTAQRNDHGMPREMLTIPDKYEVLKNINARITKRISRPRQHFSDSSFAFNVTRSDELGSSRTVPDVRPGVCRDATYPYTRVSVSVVICYHNELESVLLRTLTSVYRRSSSSLQEVILIDDGSEPMYKIAGFSTIVKQFPNLLLLATEWSGLIRCRIRGAEEAKSDILVFLDSHIEVGPDWLPPLIKPLLTAGSTTVTAPVVDIIDDNTFAYTASPPVKGGFNWNLHFRWDQLRGRSANDASPIETPVISGGLLAIRKDFFFSSGSYDKGMETWGGENIEFSIRIWSCGGKLLIIPCSRVGHIFRKRRPYGNQGLHESFTYNSLRLAKVWLDEYFAVFISLTPAATHMDPGDLEERLKLRRTCKPFSWYLENVYPNHDPVSPMAPAPPRDFLPDKRYVVAGTLRSVLGGCVAAMSLADPRQLPRLQRDTALCGHKWFHADDGAFVYEKRLCLMALQHVAVLSLCEEKAGPAQQWLVTGEVSPHGLRVGDLCLTAHFTLEYCDDERPEQQFTFG